jgi:hypothetical protein
MQPVACQFDMSVAPAALTLCSLRFWYLWYTVCSNLEVLIRGSIDVNCILADDKYLQLQKAVLEFKLEIQAHKVHSSAHLELLEYYMCQTVNSKHLSVIIQGDLNVDKYCCENLTASNPMLQYITQMSPHMNINLKWHFTADIKFRNQRIQWTCMMWAVHETTNLWQNFSKFLSGSTLKCYIFSHTFLCSHYC